MQNQIGNNTNTKSQLNSYAHMDSSPNLNSCLKLGRK